LCRNSLWRHHLQADGSSLLRFHYVQLSENNRQCRRELSSAAKLLTANGLWGASGNKAAAWGIDSAIAMNPIFMNLDSSSEGVTSELRTIRPEPRFLRDLSVFDECEHEVKDARIAPATVKAQRQRETAAVDPDLPDAMKTRMGASTSMSSGD
jgi:hypothetical protein